MPAAAPGSQRPAGPRVLICDDSPTFAAGLRRALEYDGDIHVAGVCQSAEEALSVVSKVRPDLVTMDIELPGMDGLGAVEEIMGSRPLPIVVLSAHVGPATEKAAAALAAGAVDACAKGDIDIADPAGATCAALRHRVRALAHVPVIRHPRARLRGSAATARRRREGSASVIGVCASTGGPQVLLFLLHALPPGYQIPVLVVQHVGAGFTEGLIRWLNRTVPVPVAAARDGMTLSAGAWIAPEGAHLKVRAGGRIELDRYTSDGPHRPSADALLTSIAATAGHDGVAVVLTGMGTDGARGAAAIHRAGGLVIAQDEASSAIFGMPRAAITAGADLVLPPAKIAERLIRLGYVPLEVP